jgi:trimeric autotransporter adhesin
MKHLFTLSTFLLLFCAANAQSWNFIGSSIGYNASEIDIEITPNGQLYMAYIDTDNGSKATVRKWVNNSWQLVGTAGISSTNCFDIQLVVSNEDFPAVAMKHITTIGSTNYQFLEIYRWSGAAWATQGTGGYPHTYHSMDYSLRANTAGTLFLTFYNLDYQTHDEGMITVNLSTQQQVGGTANYWNEDIYAVSSYAETGNDVKVAICELADMDYGSNLYSNNAGSWEGPSFNWGDELTKLKVEKGYATSNYCMVYSTSTPNLKFRALTPAGVAGTEYTIPTSTAVTDFDFDTYGDNAYVFYRNNATCYFKQVGGTMAPAATTITSGTLLAPANATSLAAETHYGVHVIAYISSGKCLVKEYDQEANIEDYDIFEMCEGTSFNNGGDPALFCLDPNFAHENMTMTCVSQNTAVLPQSAISIAPSADHLYWYLNITTTNDVTASTIVDLEWTLFENGIEVGSLFTPVTINPSPNIQFVFPNTTICENAGPVNLTNKAVPAGGTWSGPAVQNNTLYPGYNNVSVPTTGMLTYTKTNIYGCTASDAISVTVVPNPVLSVTTTSADCNESNGSASVSISEGQNPYNIYWSSGSTQSSVTSLTSGQYYLSVTDNNGCHSTQPVLIGTNGISQSAAVTDVTCAGLSNGGINLTVAGGSGPFTYAWSNGATTQDLSNVIAGPYEVSVTDADGCISTSSYTVEQPQAIIVNSLTIDAPTTCGDNDGGAMLSSLGGTLPYTYAWYDDQGTNLGTTTATISNLEAGMYTAAVTDGNGCTLTTAVLISNGNGPVIAIDTIITSSCSNDGAIGLTNISNNAQTFSWSNGATTQNISGLAPGTYVVEAAGENGCVTVLSAEVGSTPPIAVEICLVTVDTLTNTNLVVWEKPVTNGIESFNIYRETSQAGLYQLIGNVPYTDESLYNDPVASPSVRSWRYKISSVDACGVESEISEHHKTIHLVINLGIAPDINLSWDSYEGFNFPEFVIKRYTDVDGWQTIQTMPTNLFTYTDTPPTTDGLVYLVTIDPPATCTSTRSTAQDFNSARSNKDNRFRTQDASIDEILATNMHVYPNPAAGIVTIENNNSHEVNAQIFDAAGRLLTSIAVPFGSIQTDLSFLADGMYQIVFTTKEARASQKLTIAH